MGPAAVLAAYAELMSGGWPEIDVPLETLAADLTVERLQRAIEAATEPRGIRIFWKFGENLVFGGCNQAVANDAGLAEPHDLVGKQDYDMPWRLQASAFRLDDLAVMHSGTAKLGILERQRNASGFSYLYTSKVPIRGETANVGIFGGYEMLDAHEYARRLSA